MCIYCTIFFRKVKNVDRTKNFRKLSQQPDKSRQTKIANGAFVCCECDLQGDITIGSRTVIHPRAKIITNGAPIIIGQSNLIEEQVEIINNDPEHEMIIGDNNVFEVGAKCEAIEVGSNNVFEAKSYVGPQMKISNGCTIGALCSVDVSETLEDNVVIYGKNGDSRVSCDKPPAQGLQIDFLAKILPNYHHMMKASKSSVPKVPTPTATPPKA